MLNFCTLLKAFKNNYWWFSYRLPIVIFLLSLLLALSRSQSDVLTMQCAQEHNFDFKLFTNSSCQYENSCIIADLRIEENSTTTYEVNRTQIHEFKCLIFVASHIAKIPSNIFITARSKITHLYANDVSINELSRNSFLIANQLESVDLSWNYLQGLHETAFYDASNLETLNLSHNNISEFSSNVFDKLDNLKNLDLSHNQITSIPFDIFQPLYNLQSLDMRSNRLQLKFGMFPESLRSLDLSYNNLEIQQKFKIFALLGKLETLLLHGNLLLSYVNIIL